MSPTAMDDISEDLDTEFLEIHRPTPTGASHKQMSVSVESFRENQQRNRDEAEEMFLRLGLEEDQTLATGVLFNTRGQMIGRTAGGTWEVITETPPPSDLVEQRRKPKKQPPKGSGTKSADGPGGGSAPQQAASTEGNSTDHSQGASAEKPLDSPADNKEAKQEGSQGGKDGQDGGGSGGSGGGVSQKELLAQQREEAQEAWNNWFDSLQRHGLSSDHCLNLFQRFLDCPIVQERLLDGDRFLRFFSDYPETSPDIVATLHAAMYHDWEAEVCALGGFYRGFFARAARSHIELVKELGTLVCNLKAQKIASDKEMAALRKDTSRFVDQVNSASADLSNLKATTETLTMMVNEVKAKGMLRVPGQTSRAPPAAPRPQKAVSLRPCAVTVPSIKGPGTYESDYGTVVYTSQGATFSSNRSGKEIAYLQKWFSLNFATVTQVGAMNRDLEALLEYFDSKGKWFLALDHPEKETRQSIIDEIRKLPIKTNQWTQRYDTGLPSPEESTSN